MFRDLSTVVVKNFSDDMKVWLESQFEEGQYVVQPHTKRIKYSGPPKENGLKIMGGPTHPWGDDFKYDGWEIVFKGEADAVLFKLTFQDEIGKSNSEFDWGVF